MYILKSAMFTVFFVLVSSNLSKGQTNEPCNLCPTPFPPVTTEEPLPVQIISGPPTSSITERRLIESIEREKEDLIAQKGMDASTKQINTATQKMAFDTRLMNFATWIGLALLGITLWLTRSANRAAFRAVEVNEKMGRTQIRAYVDAHVQFFSWSAKSPSRGRIMIGGRVHNTGATPATDLSYSGSCKVQFSTDCTPLEVPCEIARRLPKTFELAGQSSSQITFLSSRALNDKEMELLERGKSEILVNISFTYKDVFGELFSKNWEFHNSLYREDDFSYEMVRKQ